MAILNKESRERETRKRKIENGDRTEENRIIKAKNKRERRKANEKQKVAREGNSESNTNKEEAEINLTASDNELKNITTEGEGFGEGGLSGGGWMGDYCMPEGSVSPPPAGTLELNTNKFSIYLIPKLRTI